ncbi:MAG: hypothetical protein RMI32_08545, partial [Candidatus Nitrosocaldus sp.]|nr:hypothetical protein [Candidatus Nitrosocaldus sp.]
IVPAKVFRGDMIDVIQKTVVVDTDKTVYDALCRVTEYATHTTKKEHQLYTMTRKMSKLVYDIVRDSGRLTE